MTLVPDAFAIRVLAEQQAGRTVAKGVRWRGIRTHEQHEETAQVVVLSAECTENPRLWLNSELPNPNGWVGRGYTDHSIDWVIGVFDEYTGNSKGASSSARADYPGHGAIEQVGLPPALQALTFGLSDSGVRSAYDNGRGPTGAWDGKADREFLCDQAATTPRWPTPSAGPHPTLTNQAVTTRTAERIVSGYFGGAPWVRTHSPVGSLDDRVTRGVLDGALAR